MMQSHKATSVTCRAYSALPDKRVCQHYVAGGGCDLRGDAKCLEWLDRRGQQDAGPAVQGSKGSLALKAKQQLPAPTSPAMTTEQQAAMTDLLTRVEAGSVEALVRSEGLGEIWVVPAYTDKARKEITVQDAAAMCRIQDLFPESRVVSFKRLSATGTASLKNQNEAKSEQPKEQPAQMGLYDAAPAPKTPSGR